MRKINKIIVHCSDSPHGRGDDVNTIRQWHLERGFRDVGYHYVIIETGELQYGRTIDRIGAHCRKHNSDSIGICLIGKNYFTFKQLFTLKILIESLQNVLPHLTVHGHCEFDDTKTCPNIDIQEIIGEIKDE